MSETRWNYALHVDKNLEKKKHLQKHQFILSETKNDIKVKINPNNPFELKNNITSNTTSSNTTTTTTTNEQVIQKPTKRDFLARTRSVCLNVSPLSLEQLQFLNELDQLKNQQLREKNMETDENKIDQFVCVSNFIDTLSIDTDNNNHQIEIDQSNNSINNNSNDWVSTTNFVQQTIPDTNQIIDNEDNENDDDENDENVDDENNDDKNNHISDENSNNFANLIPNNQIDIQIDKQIDKHLNDNIPTTINIDADINIPIEKLKNDSNKQKHKNKHKQIDTFVQQKNDKSNIKIENQCLINNDDLQFAKIGAQHSPSTPPKIKKTISNASSSKGGLMGRNLSKGLSKNTLSALKKERGVNSSSSSSSLVNHSSSSSSLVNHSLNHSSSNHSSNSISLSGEHSFASRSNQRRSSHHFTAHEEAANRLYSQAYFDSIANDQSGVSTMNAPASKMAQINDLFDTQSIDYSAFDPTWTMIVRGKMWSWAYEGEQNSSINITDTRGNTMNIAHANRKNVDQERQMLSIKTLQGFESMSLVQALPKFGCFQHGMLYASIEIEPENRPLTFKLVGRDTFQKLSVEVLGNWRSWDYNLRLGSNIIATITTKKCGLASYAICVKAGEDLTLALCCALILDKLTFLSLNRIPLHIGEQTSLDLDFGGPSNLARFGSQQASATVGSANLSQSKLLRRSISANSTGRINSDKKKLKNKTNKQK
eukprot:TRINITY_DN417_c0_g1_i1.p1 TRINITY_DN417_c0_g1~~TRINITY_DN417_c0_g1_i1.p1  ORF type:complete len:710 (-),score=288.53 TRINITY_DN417_c0_g1_i1:187-2316(-)